ncbi:MAG: carbon monoxide dehydrogenase subunit G [Thermomicrobiales bacterium]
MQFSGEEHIKAPRDKVWAFVTDPEKIAQCAPGLEDDGLQIIDEDHFKVKVQAGVGFIRSTFEFNCEWAERDEPNKAVIKANGDAPGSSVTMTATMDLHDDEEGGTIMNWATDAQISGRLAGVGGRLINPVADRMTSQVFDCVREKLEE